MSTNEFALGPFAMRAKWRKRILAIWGLLLSGILLCYLVARTLPMKGGLWIVSFIFLSVVALIIVPLQVSNQAFQRARSELRKDLREFRNSYSQAPAPGKAARMLECYIAFGRVSMDWGSSYKTWVAFFARVAQGHPEVVRAYEELLPEAPHGERAIVLRVLSIAGDQKTHDFLETCLHEKRFRRERERIGEILRGPFPETGFLSERDLAWAAFEVAGDPKVILEHITMLERPDRVREKLEAWMRSASCSAGQAERLARIGITLDLESKQVVNADDLDLLCDVQKRRVGSTTPEPPEAVAQALPFRLSEEDIRYLANKTLAKKMLTTIARNATLLQACEAETEKREGRVRLVLSEIVARV